MTPIENSAFKNQIIHKMSFSFGEIYLLKDCVVSELKEDTVGTAEQAKLVIDKCVAYYDRYDVVKRRVWIANRIHRYSVKPVGWIQLKDLAKQYLSGYCVIDNSTFGIMNAILESKFVPINFKSAKSLEEAMEWVKEIATEQEKIEQ